MTLVMVADPLEMFQPYAQERAAIEAAGAEFRLGDGSFAAIRDADVVLTTWTLRFPAHELQKLHRCRMVARYGVGVDNIDLAAATELGIVVANAPTYCVGEVADHTVGLILTLTRGLAWLDREVRAGRWMAVHKDDPRVPRLSLMTIGLVGLGKIGRRVAQRLAGFGCRILAYDPYLSDAEIRERGALPVASLTELLQAADLVSLHVPLTDETRRMINRTTLAQLRPGAMVVNTSRGGVIDEQALVEALQRDHLFGVALDVLDPEPIRADHPLLAMDPRRVILTPHFGAWCRASTPDLQTEIANAVTALLSGRLPPSTMNPAVQPRFGLIR